jgi:hypothetical protein
MDIEKSRTIRFSRVVEESGRPELVTLWQAPDQNRTFRTALHQDRVMTILREPVGTKKDFGVIGYLKKRNVSFLIFPRSLKAFHEKRVVGIKYHLIAPSKPRGKPVRLQNAEGRRVALPKNKTKSKVGPFQVTIRCTAVAEVRERVEATNKADASEQAMERVTRRTIDFPDASVSRKIVKVKKLGNPSSEGTE